ncbi:inovirus-type Gp2 protein [Burkholderia sp. BCC1638]|uniref:inovirus-type Gp2 protein n=1 Tax=Burkholderia sp. BCC1638 TaxID=2681391 RepID=UPI00158C9966|nr:inovirus-type Gp2 protein [Burkholderia sp. BCC1638]
MSYEDDDFYKIYKFSDFVINTEGEEVDDRECLLVHPDFDMIGPVLAEIEALVRDIEFSEESDGFVIERNAERQPVIVVKPMGERYWTSVMRFFQHYAFDERYVFSPHVEALREAIGALGLHPDALPFCCSPRGSIVERLPEEVFNGLLAKVLEIVGTSAFREQLRVRKRNAERNEAKGLAIERQIFENKSRRLVLMLHFGYQAQYRSSIRLEEMQRHRKKFFNNCRSNKLLRGIRDYIWKIEEGNDSGLHLHVLIFYTANSCRDVYIAQQIGEYWVKVTDGKGKYWNSNADKAKHAKYGHGIGTGEINWDDHNKREALRRNIQYMTKADQFLKMKYGEHCRVFGTSQVKEKEKSGRPRTVKPTLQGEPAGGTQADSFDSESLDNTSADATDLDADQNE